MGEALIVKVSQKISNTLDFNLDQLSKSLALPSQAVIYGEKVIIGYKNLALSEYNMMILYSKSISSYDKTLFTCNTGLFICILITMKIRTEKSRSVMDLILKA